MVHCIAAFLDTNPAKSKSKNNGFGSILLCCCNAAMVINNRSRKQVIRVKNRVEKGIFAMESFYVKKLTAEDGLTPFS